MSEVNQLRLSLSPKCFVHRAPYNISIRKSLRQIAPVETLYCSLNVFWVDMFVKYRFCLYIHSQATLLGTRVQLFGNRNC